MEVEGLFSCKGILCIRRLWNIILVKDFKEKIVKIISEKSA
jgi:hypothetical protein